MNQYILTGTPGSGKTSLIRALETQGHAVVNEAITDMIAAEQARGVAEPWMNSAFVDQVVLEQRRRQLATDGLEGELCFFDRSPICTFALCQLLEHPPSKVLMEAIERMLSEGAYENQVFFIENLGFVEKTDARQISYEDAVAFEEMHRDAYRLFGFELAPVPPVSIPERVALILQACT